MFTDKQLKNSLQSASSFILNSKGLDTLAIRKRFEEDTSLTDDDKAQILSYLDEHVSDALYIKVKACIDQSENASKYFRNHPTRKFRGAYSPVVMQLIAALMVDSIVTKIDDIDLKGKYVVDDDNNPWCEADSIYDVE